MSQIDSNPKAAFEYKFLQPGEIRLIRVGHWNGDLSISFRTVDLHHLPVPYIAISYCWGDARRVGQLDVNGSKVIQITKAVKDVLVWLADRHDVEYFWLDFLSIDQANLAERAQQVSIMHEIFSRCKRVNAWLGKGIQHGEEAFELFSRVANDMRKYFKQTASSDPYAFRKTCCQRGYHKEVWKTLGLIQAPWFQRYWIVQETVLAPDLPGGQGLILCCNSNCQLPWSDLAIVCTYKLLSHEYARENYDAVLALRVNSRFIASTYDLRMSHLAGKPVSLVSGLLACSKFSAGDSRDRIYAVTQICQQLEHENIVPNYGSSEDDVYLSATRTMLVENRLFDTLTAAGVAVSTATKHLPSWVPDWTQTADRYLLIRLFDGTSWNACDSAAAYIDRSPEFKSLTFRGVIVDSVRQRFTTPLRKFNPRSVDRHVVAGITWWAKQITHCVENSPVYKASSVIEKRAAIWKILSALWNVNKSTEKDPLAPYMTWLKVTEHINALDYEYQPTAEEMYLKNDFEFALIGHMHSTVFLTGSSYLGMAPRGVRDGDAVCVLYGLRYPCLLRRTHFASDKPQEWRLISVCYVDQMMHGEALRRDLPEQDFTVV